LAQQLGWRRRFESDEKGEGPTRGLESRRKKRERRGAPAMVRWPSKGPVRMYLYVWVGTDKYAKAGRVRWNIKEKGYENRNEREGCKPVT
jgi:hypothetical protein